VERELPGAGKLTREQLREVAQKSNGVIQTLGPKIQWVETFIVDDKLYCIYNAPSPKLIEEHAKCGGFPANRISQIRGMMDPTTAEA
jgi:uncharacterized protein DUF4242